MRPGGKVAWVSLRREEKDTDLLNLRDEMLSQLNKLKYLLTLN